MPSVKRSALPIALMAKIAPVATQRRRRSVRDMSDYARVGSTADASGNACDSIWLSGVQWTRVSVTRFPASGRIRVMRNIGMPHTLIDHNLSQATPAPTIRELYYQGPARAVLINNSVKEAR